MPERVLRQELLVDHGCVLVAHDGGRDVPPLPAGTGGTVVEVYVLAIHAEAGIPAADLVEHLAPQQNERAEHRVGGNRLVPPPRPDTGLSLAPPRGGEEAGGGGPRPR